VQMDFFIRVKSCCWITVCAALSAWCVCVCVRHRYWLVRLWTLVAW